jgi:hypothetical protein
MISRKTFADLDKLSPLATFWRFEGIEFVPYSFENQVCQSEGRQAFSFEQILHHSSGETEIPPHLLKSIS